MGASNFFSHCWSYLETLANVWNAAESISSCCGSPWIPLFCFGRWNALTGAVFVFLVPFQWGHESMTQMFLLTLDFQLKASSNLKKQELPGCWPWWQWPLSFHASWPRWGNCVGWESSDVLLRSKTGRLIWPRKKISFLSGSQVLLWCWISTCSTSHNRWHSFIYGGHRIPLLVESHAYTFQWRSKNCIPVPAWFHSPCWHKSFF